MRYKISLFLLFFCVAIPSVWSMNGNEILRQVDERLQPASFESYRKIINIEPSGRQKEFVLYTLKKGDNKVVSLFLEPSSDRGRSTLRLGDNMWLYIPGVSKPMRITSMQSVTGGVFNNSDILGLDFSVEYDVPEMTENDTTYTLKLKAKNATVAYDAVTMTVDKQTLAPIQLDCYASTGILIKTITYKERKVFDGGIERPSVIETTSPLQKGYTAAMIYGKLTPRELQDEYFTLEFMPKLESLRK